MNIQSINAFNIVNFKGKIIDSHVHTGRFNGKTYTPENLDVFIKSPLAVEIQGKKQTDTVEKMLVSNLSSINGRSSASETEGNLEMLDICSKNDKLVPLAVCRPENTFGDTGEMRELLDGGDFAGLKFHPEATGLRADDFDYDPYLDLAEEKGLPCLFHSQVNLNWHSDKDGNSYAVENKEQKSNSDPEFIYSLAKRHPNVPVIMAHLGAGGDLAHKKATDILIESIDNKDANLYCDISWVDFKTGLPDEESENIVNLISKLKERNALDRVMFGTDAPLGCYGEKTKGGLSPKEAYEKTVGTFKTVIKDNFPDDGDEIIQKIFFDNANNLFKLDKYKEEEE